MVCFQNLSKYALLLQVIFQFTYTALVTEIGWHVLEVTTCRGTMTSLLQGINPLPLFGQARPSAHTSALGTRCCEQTPHPLMVKASLQTPHFPGHSIPSYVHVSCPLSTPLDMLKCRLPASAKFTTQSIPCCKLIRPPLPLPVPLALASPTWCIRDVSLLPLRPLIETLKSAGLSIALCRLHRLSHISRQVREQRAILWKPAWESELRTETWSSKWRRQEEVPTRPTEMSAPYKVISERLLTLQCSIQYWPWELPTTNQTKTPLQRREMALTAPL